MCHTSTVPSHDYHGRPPWPHDPSHHHQSSSRLWHSSTITPSIPEWGGVEWNMCLLEASKFQNTSIKTCEVSLCCRFISTSFNLQIFVLAQFKTSRLCFVTCHLAFVSLSLNDLINPLYLSIFSFKGHSSHSFSFQQSNSFSPTWCSFWASTLSCLWKISPGWQTCSNSWASCSVTPFLSLKAKGIHSFLVSSGSSNTFSDLVFTVCFFFAFWLTLHFLLLIIPKTHSLLFKRGSYKSNSAMVLQRNFTRTLPGNCSPFWNNPSLFFTRIFDSDTFHTFGLCRLELASKYKPIQTWTQSIQSFVFHLL